MHRVGGAARSMGKAVKIDGGIVGQRVGLEVSPEIFDRIEFGSVGRQADESDVCEVVGDVIAGAIEDESGVCTRSDLTADLGEMQGHGFGVGGW